MKKSIICFLLTLFICHNFLLAKNDYATRLLGQVKYPNHLLNCVWGYHDKGKEYALVGTYDGISIVDVTEPTTPKEIHFIPTVNSVWKDIQTHKNYAYVVHGIYNGQWSDADGLLIIDLNTLGKEKVDIYRFQTPEYQTAHNIFIDTTTSRAYLFGGQERGGALILDLSKDPKKPTVLGSYDGTYLHDGYVRNNILYGCADKNGRFIVVNVSDPEHPKEVNSAETPNRTTHNAWLSDDSNTLFTTDEKLSAFITSFDISDVKNIQLLGKVRTEDYQSAVPHNATVVGDFIFSSYYNQGMKIFDASFPENMIEVASYSTCDGSMGQFDGAWGIYPYLPSGNILVSDMNTGLHVVKAELKKACYLSGTVIDEMGSPIFNAEIHFKDDKSSVYTDMNGIFHTGKNTEGMRNVEINALGYQSVNMDVDMRSGVLSMRNIVLRKDDSGKSAIMETYVKAYPNPFYADRLLNVDYSFKEGIDGAAYLIIMDLAGRELYREELFASSGVVIVGKELPKGVYLLRVFNGSLYSRVIKIVKA